MRFGRVGRGSSALWSILVYLPVAHWVFARRVARRARRARLRRRHRRAHQRRRRARWPLVLRARHAGAAGRSDPMPPHSLPLTLLGTGILWFGWFGFNAGSALARERRRRAGVHQHVRRGRRGDARLAGRRADQGAATPRRSAPRRARSPGSSRSRRAPASSAGWRRSPSASSPAWSASSRSA